MNAHVQIERLVLGDIDDFAECAGYQAWFFSEGWIDLHTAVDNLQRLAELWGLVDDVGQDRVQEIMAEMFAQVRERA
jgi:hypothetical protein